MNRNGITAGGNWIVDKTKIIDDYPPQDGLCNILEESESNGGSPYNVLKDISKLGVDIKLEGIGLIGNDLDGEFILNDCKNHQIGTTNIQSAASGSTSYTNVMTSKLTGRRTFFHHRGVNAQLDIDHFDVEKLDCKIFHFGYLLLLDKFDVLNEQNRTQASILLERVQAKGIATSVDIVSENSNRFSSIVPSSLPFIDYLFVNEYEASKITSIKLKDEGGLDIEQLIVMARKLIELGVKKFVFLHFPDGVVTVDMGGKVWKQGKVKLPSNLIKGSSGAGDAFAAGVLYGLHEDSQMTEILKFGVCMAACSLLDVTSSDGIKPLDQIIKIGIELGFYQLQ